jgi:hypothetical protein
MLFRAKAVTLEEIKHKSSQTMPQAVPCLNESEDKDLLESDTKVKQRTFEVGDLVLLRSPRTESSGKLGSKWDGSYTVIEKSRPGAYHLSNSQGRTLEHSWNANNLRRFYT